MLLIDHVILLCSVPKEFFLLVSFFYKRYDIFGNVPKSYVVDISLHYRYIVRFYLLEWRVLIIINKMINWHNEIPFF